jgi:pyruvate dehydrogenase E2 component (dihydrolipoamide acetyltransferase)
MAEIVNMPKLGFDMAEGTLVHWVIGEGEQVSEGDVLAEIETDKATVEVESYYDGVILRHLVQEDTVVPVGDPIAVVGEDGEEVDIDSLLGKAPEAGEAAKPEEEAEERRPEKEEKPIPAPEEGVEEGAHLPGGVRASPLARRMAEDKGIDLKKVEGTGPQGRVLKADIQAFEEARPEVMEAAPREAPAAPVPTGAPRETQRMPLSRLRGAIGRRMSRSFQEIPHFYVTHEYDMGQVMQVRKQVNEMMADEEKISVNDFILKAVALTLREFPNLNASLDEENQEVIRHGPINIGVAVAVENGLLTVVCKNADFKPLSVISREVRTMAGRAREGKVRSDEVEGSTFSISNMGMFDVEHFTAIINPPEAAILAIGSAREVPVIEDGQVKPAIKMKVTISIDHRISDGAEAARFLQALAKYLEEPLRLMI